MVGTTQAELERLERETLAGLDVVVSRLDRVLRLLRDGDRDPDSSVPRTAQRLAEVSTCVYEELLVRVAKQSLAGEELRLIAALLNLIPCISRIGDQCSIVAALAQRLNYPCPDPTPLEGSIERMGALARSQLVRARRAFEHRDGDAVERLVRHDAEIRRASSEMFGYAARVREASLRERANLAVVIASSLERMADGAVEIGEQAFLLRV